MGFIYLFHKSDRNQHQNPDQVPGQGFGDPLAVPLKEERGGQELLPWSTKCWCR